jgi:two-component system OmpR family response regulator
MKILLLEDDAELARFIAKGLRERGYVVEHAVDGREGLFIATEQAFDLIVTDRMMPHLDGLSILQLLRQKGVDTPVIVLSALGSIDDRVKGLQAGGDDYLVKPFAFAELLARIEALLRRRTSAAPAAGGAGAVGSGAGYGASGALPSLTLLRVGPLELDALSRRVTREGRPIELTAREFQLLEFLMRRAGQVVTRTMLLEGVWDFHFDPQTNVIDVHISRLRTAIDRGFERRLLHTIRGAGYMIRESDPAF